MMGPVLVIDIAHKPNPGGKMPQDVQRIAAALNPVL
jgi:hypothetical protein